MFEGASGSRGFRVRVVRVTVASGHGDADDLSMHRVNMPGLPITEVSP
jgi:hypothetical protein